MNFYNKIFLKIIFIIGCLGVLDTVTLLSYIPGINVGTLFPGFVGIIFIIVSYIKLNFIVNRPLIENKNLRKTLYIAIITFIISFILIEGIIVYSSKTDNANNVDYLLILGTGLNGKDLSATLQYRMDKGLDFLNKNPNTMVIVSGGQGPNEEITEAAAMKDYLIKNNIDDNKILTEDKSSSTMENLKFSKEIILKNRGDINSNVMIVTSDFHMFRTKMLAKRNDIKAYGMICETTISVKINCYIREYFAVIKSVIFDRV